jgi:hypothetical protein
MSTSVARLAVTGVLVCGTVLAGLGTASAAGSPTPPDTATSYTPAGRVEGAVVDGVPRPEQLRKRTATTTPRSNRSAGASATTSTSADVTEIGSVCPAGYVPGTTRAVVDFESGAFPFPGLGLTEGWSIVSGSAASGTRHARSRLTAPGQIDAANFMTTTAVEGLPSSGALVMAFSYKASYPTGLVDNDPTQPLAEVGVLTNFDYGVLAPTSGWTRVTLDVTDTLADDPGNFFSLFDNYLAPEATTSSTIEVDDIRVYSCASAPVSGVRGDWSGEGTVDLLGTTAAGDLYLYPGRGNGAVSSGQQVGSGWSGFDWLGSPGDITGDRRTDLLARRDDGVLYLYPGKGGGAFGSATQLAIGWDLFTAVSTPGDVTGDRRPDILARAADGTLHLYSVTSTAVARLRQVGSGWQGMAWIIGIGDLNRDGRGDTVGVNRGDGCLYAYTATTVGGLGSARKVGCGWAGMTWLTSPGDLDRDGFGDLVARTSTGDLWFYRGKSGGGVVSGVKVGSGWNGLDGIL